VNRQIGLLIDRQGRPFMVVVGDASRILIPELPRAREGAGRLRGLRLLVTHLTEDLLRQEDLLDMLFLRLDSVCVLTVDSAGQPLKRQHAHLLPPNPEGKTSLIHSSVRWDLGETDFAAEAAALEEELARSSLPLAAESSRPAGAGGQAALRAVRRLEREKGRGAENRAILVSVSESSRSEQEASLAELADLAATAGIGVAGTLIQRVAAVNPRIIIGRGRLADLEVLALQGNAGLIIFDGELSPAQLHNLAEITERRVLDRTQVILDIFAQRAVSAAGKFQVELAQLQYLLPRLTGKTRALDRLAGGIGGRGPGETKLETDRRRLRERVARIKDDLKDLRRRRAQARSRRAKGNIPVASLVGYTNAGKSTLLNRLTGSSVLAEDRLFATLDPATRRLRFPRERELILTDTVGFIRSLPKELMEAFQATLEELEEADLLLHVADAAHPELDMHISAVDEILIRLRLQNTPRLLIFNKIDALPGEALQILKDRHPEAFFLSALSGQGLCALSRAIADLVDWERGSGLR
jgi:GTP-binding protein HflX